MKFHPAAALAATVLIIGCSGGDATAEQQTAVAPAQKSVDAEPVRAKEVKAKRGLERRMIEAMETGSDTQALLFTRMSPGSESLVKPVKLKKEDREVISCVVDAARKADLEDHLEYGLQMSDRLTAAVEADETLTMATLENHPEIEALMTGSLEYGSDEEQERMQAINKECGMIGMAMRVGRESGIMDVMMNSGSALDGE
ncbi:MAG: hypothetical protein AAF311_02985 [Pseudomonadota bacterium]